jgi:SP family arabinose:H+ symporter-like MFS transporter
VRPVELDMPQSTSNPTAAIARSSFHKTYIWTISLVAALGGLLFGYDWVVIGGAKPFYEEFFNLSDPTQQGWAMSCALIGCLVGALVAGDLSDRYGRKRLLIASALLFAISSLGTGAANTFSTFVAWRIMGGVAIGLASALSPLYIAEVAPAEFRGRLVSINQLTIVIGILLAQIINWLIADPVPPGASPAQIYQSWNGQVGWRWMFAVTAVPASFFFVGMLLVPESPRWLAKSGQHGKARRILDRIGGSTYADEAMREIEATLRAEHKTPLKELFAGDVTKPLVLGVVLAVFQQWCGINVIFNYAEEVFSAAGFTLSDMLFNIVVTGTVNLAFTFVALATVDRFGRRILMLAGSAGLAVIYVLLGAAYYSHSQGIYTVALVVAAIACYATSLAPVTWVVISEIFPNRIRGTAVSVAVAALWIASFILTITFPELNRRFGAAGTFWIYAGVCVAGFGFVYWRLPETKGKTLEEIERTWTTEDRPR